MTHFETLGKYHVLERLAASRLAEIYKVKTVGIAGFEKVQVLNRIVPTYARDPSFLRAFIAEAKIAFSLNHRNIVQVFEFGKMDGELFLATEYIPGVNLQEVLYECRRQQRIVPLGLSCYLMGEVAAGLEYAHRKSDQSGQALDVVHGDLSPYNIGCSWEGSVKVLDFGICRAAWTAAAEQDRYRGLPRYLSPEQVRAEALAPSGDIFSFGVILWELLAGQPLMAGKTVEDVEEQILDGHLPSPRELNREVPVELDALTLRCLERSAQRRIGSANELQIELHRIQRQVGAVIGSRALSTFLHDLFPSHAETRDVRQEGSGTAPPEPPARRRPEPIRALVDAAAELAQPQNPPAEAVRDPRRRRHPPTRDHEEPVIERRASQEARVAGVLRSTRHVDEELVVAPPQRRRRRKPSLSNTGSSEITAGPEPITLPPLAPDGPRHTEELSPEQFDRILTADDDDLRSVVTAHGADTIPPSSDDDSLNTVATDIASAEVVAAALRAVSTTDGRAIQDLTNDLDDDAINAALRASEEEEDDDGPDLAAGLSLDDDDDELSRPELELPPLVETHGDQLPLRVSPMLLGEKKRFIAAAVLADGAPEARADALQLVADIAYKLEGLIHLHDEHRLIALFGLPMADENDIVSAVRCARDALEAIAHLQPDGVEDVWSDEGVGLRIGIRAGTARMGGAPSREGYHVLGNSIAETVALADHGVEAQVHVAGAAARLASMHYVLREVDAVRRHGKPLRCYRVLGPHPPQRTRDAGEPLVGREIELSALRSAWRETVLGGQQGSMLIVGDAGLGKTRLVDEFLLRHGSDAWVLAAAATPHRRETPHAVLVDLLRGATGVAGTATPRSRARLLERLEQALASLPAELREDTLDTVESIIDPHARPLGESADSRRSRVHAALRAVLTALSQQRPLIVVLEDLHWADSSSVECVSSLVNRPEEARGPLMLLVTARPEELALDELFVEGIVSHVQLDELDVGDRQQLIMECLGEPDSELIGEIERRAGGNPFYIRELAHAARELDSKAFSSIPHSVRGVLAGRIDRLPSQVKVVLQHAAVIGPIFREGILTRLLSRNPARSLAELRNRGVLVPGVNMAVPYTAGTSEQFEREWAFRHVLVQQVIYEALSTSDRRELHRKVGEIMARRAARGSSDPASEVARHLELAGQRDEAADYYLQAADAAAASYANKEAAKLYDRAVALADDDEERLYRAISGRERVYGRLGLHDRQASDLDRLRQIGGDDASRRADLRAREALRLLRIGEVYRALEAAEQAEAAAIEAGDELQQGEALRLRGEAYERLNDLPRAFDTVKQALEIFVQQQAPAHEVRARIGLGRVLLLQAQYDDALEQYAPALELIKRTEDRWQERILRNNTAVVHLCRGHFARALDDAMYSLKLCVEFGDVAREGDNATVIGIIYLELGLFEAARRYLDDALGIHRETGSRWSEADTLVYAGLLSAAEGKPTEALACLEEARTLARAIGAKYIEINAHNGLAHVYCERRNATDAQRALEAASEGFERAGTLGLRIGEIPGLSRAARAQAQLGQLEAARALSRRAVELLDAQRHIDGPEEEIYYTHYRILAKLGDPSAAEALERAYEGVTAKLALLADPQQRQCFAQTVRLNAAILRDARR